MSLQPIAHPLPGERVVALSPQNATEAAALWLRRPNVFPGRALTAATLQQRQQWQAGRIALRGQEGVPGVVTGLEVSAATVAGQTGFAATRIRIERGRALAASGEDVVLNRPLECLLADVPVVAPPGFFANGSGVSDPSADGSLRPRALNATLGTLVPAAQATLPAVGVLVLQPVTVDTANLDPLDPCDRSACDEGQTGDPAAFEDWRIADGVRLVWYVWPTEWRSLQAPDAAQRNHLAWTVFQAEAALASGAVLPWQEWGAPVAMVRLDAARRPVWLDRASVVRQGGRSRDARLLLAGGALGADSRLPALWRARIEQFAEQVAAAGDPSPRPADLAAGFARFLPPVGLLPRNAFDVATRRSEFFPAGFDLDAAPVPVEQLDLAVRASAGLAPLDLSAAESVRLLVPVPLASWEPRLLLRETVDPEFQRTLDRFLLDRSRALGGRQGLRTREALLQRAITGTLPPVTAFDDDDEALERESLSPWGPPPPGGGHRSALRAGLHQHYFERAGETFAIQGDRLYCWVYLDPEQPPRMLMLQWHSGGTWEHRAYWGENLAAWGQNGTASRARLGDLPTRGAWVRLEVPAASVGLAQGSVIDGMAFTLYDGRAAYGMTGSATGNGETKWFCNVLPGGAQRFGDEPFELLTHNDLWAPFEPTLGVLPAQADVLPPTSGAHHDGGGEGVHQHFIDGVTTPFTAAAGESLFAWAYLDPNNPPRTVMLQWRTQAGGWEQRAFWGHDLMPWGVSGTNSRRRAGALPQPGRWVRLEVSAQSVGLEGVALIGIAFTLHGGHAVFGAAGAGPRDGNGRLQSERVWFAGSLPPGAVARGLWNFVAPRDMVSPTPAANTGQVQALADLYAHPALQVLSDQERAQLYLRGVEGFAAYLASRADRADDIVDYGFVKVQTDVYRVRQLVLGTTAATRLAVSPALASIAQAETAVASQTQIASFLSELKLTPGGVAAPGPSAPRAMRRFVAEEAPATVALARRTAPAESGDVAVGGLHAMAPGAQAAMAIGGLSIGGMTTMLAREEVVEARPVIRVQTASPTPKPVAREVAAASGITPIIRVALPPPPSPREVVNASPLIGQSFVRTTTLAQRLEDPKSKEARDYATASRFESVTALVRLHDALTDEDGGIVPGLFEGLDVRGLEDDGFLADVPVVEGRKPVSRPFADFIANRGLLRKMMEVPLRLPPQIPGAAAASSDPDEAAMFSDATDLSDHVVALMRKMEGRIKLYRDAVAACQPVLQELRAGVATANTRLRGVAEQLAEARHDVSVARALFEEEMERVDGINERRARVLAEEVKFIAFVRPREADTLRATPTHAVDPGLVEPPVPACLREHPDVPEALDDMLRVVREAPARWFVNAPPLLHKLDRVDYLVRTLETAQVRALAGIAMPALAVQKATPIMAMPFMAMPAGVFAGTQAAPARALGVANAAAGFGLFNAMAATVKAPAARLQASITQVATRQAEALAPRLAAVRTLDVAGLAATATWQAVRAQAEEVVSFADLAEGGHGRADVARAAAAELANIRSIAACLHAEFSGVMPSLRLDWAEALSAFDDPPNLRNLASLPRWAEIPYIDRRQMQAYVDWLFAQVEPNQPQGVALVNDVVRMCLLLASHAPVDRIVAGRMARPVAGVVPGVRIPLAVADPARLRVGMAAMLMRGDNVVARAVVEDVGRLEVSAHVVHTVAARLDLGDDVRVHFDDAAMLSLKAAGAKRTRFGR